MTQPSTPAQTCSVTKGTGAANANVTGKVLKDIGTVTGYSSLYGLAGWQGVVYGFDASGAVLKIDIATGAPTLVANTGNSWWGAGVSTRIPSP
jgi:hypothetical protein